MNYFIIFIYTALLLFTIIETIRVSNRFFIVFLLLLSFSPMMQYIVFPEMNEGQYFAFPLRRIYCELINIFIVLIFLVLSVLKKRINMKGRVMMIFLAFLWICTSSIQLFFSIDFERSIVIYLFGVILPFLIFVSFAIHDIFEYSKIELLRIFILSLACFIIFNLSITYIGYFYYVFLKGFGSFSSLDFLRNSQVGVFRSNAGINYLAHFIPFIFIKYPYLYPKEKKIVNVAKVMFVMLFIFTLSRTGTLILVLGFLFIFLYSKKFGTNRKKLLLYIFLFLILALNLFPNLIDFATERFFYKGNTVSEAIKYDPRMLIWETADLNILKNPFTGYGLGAFYHLSPLVDKFSNAHNIFRNILLERGIFAIITLFITIIFYIRINVKINKLNCNDPNIVKLFLGLRIGLLLYFIMSFTSEELIVTGGPSHSLPMIIIIYLLAFHYIFYNATKKEY